MANAEVPAVWEFDWRESTAEEFARILFDRPIATTDAQKDAQVGHGDFDYGVYDGDPRFVRLCIDLFTRFGDVSAPYSTEQIDQGLWFVHGDPYFLSDVLGSKVAPDLAIACVESVYYIYADFLAARQGNENVGALYMWWDDGWDDATPEFLGAVFRTMERILALPEVRCRRAALHGLAHFKQDHDESAAKAAIDRFLARERPKLTSEEVAYAEFCRDEFHI